MKSILIAVMLLACGVIAEAQQTGKIFRIGWLSAGSGGGRIEKAIQQDLRQRGYLEGRNLFIEWRLAEGNFDRLPGLVTDLVAKKVDVIVVSSTQAVLAAKKATQTIPIVFGIADNPVEMGLVASLAHPGGNVTGLTDIAGELAGKRLEILKETVPKLARLALLVWTPDGPGNAVEKTEIEAAARVFKVQIQPVETRGAEDLTKGFAAMAKAGANAFMGLTDTRFSASRPRLLELAAKYRLPAIYPERVFAEAGGLMSYGTNRVEFRRRLAIYIDRVLQGTNPTDLPVEQPMKFEFIVNLKTAKQMNFTVPPNVLVRATRMIR